jgi:metal-responsive CopG/Arc/MetJ family transcriptional regulator
MLMQPATRQANFTLPSDLLEELRRAVPRGEQSRLVAEALRNELARLRFRAAIDRSFGAWRASRHPELARGTRRFVRELRKSARTRRRSGT